MYALSCAILTPPFLTLKSLAITHGSEHLLDRHVAQAVVYHVLDLRACIGRSCGQHEPHCEKALPS